MIAHAPSRRQDVIRLYGEAAALLAMAREGRAQTGAVAAESTRILQAFEVACATDQGDEAAQLLRRWARDLVSGRFVVASVHLDRAGLALGVRASDARAELSRPPAEEPSAPSSQEVQGAFDGLNRAERSLLELLPPSGEPLHGAAALAACWGDAMSPTSARGRYSRLATKLERLRGRPVLMRGRGCYGRLD